MKEPQILAPLPETFKGFRVTPRSAVVRLDWFDDDRGWLPGVAIMHDLRIQILPSLRFGRALNHHEADTLHRILHAAVLMAERYATQIRLATAEDAR